jgi:hypothetical protein
MCEILFASALDGAFVVRIEANSSTRISAHALAVLSVRACASGCAVFEEEIQEFVFDGEVGGLAELLEGG